MNAWINKSLVFALGAVVLASGVQAQPQPQFRGDDRGPHHMQPGPGNGPDPRAGRGPDQRPNNAQSQPHRPAPPQAHPSQGHGPSGGARPMAPNHAQPPHHPAPHAQHRERFQPGHRLEQQYRGHQYVVDNWRAHNLRQPARGQHWVMVGGDYLLVTIASGIIMSVLMGH